MVNFCTSCSCNTATGQKNKLTANYPDYLKKKSMRSCYGKLRIVVLLLGCMVVSAAFLPVKRLSYATIPKRILFVGNSLTYTNDLPALVVAVAAKKGIAVETGMLAYPNYALPDHWEGGKLQQMLASGHFDFVVVQQGPSSQEEGRQMLMEYGKKIKALCDQHQSKLAFYMVWPAFSNYQMFDGVIKNYSDVASATNSILCPVGKVWKAHIDSSRDPSYYGPDMFHPSQKGSEVAAEVICRSLFE